MPPEFAPESMSFIKAWLKEYDRAFMAKSSSKPLQPPEKPYPAFTEDQYVEAVQDRLGDQDFLSEDFLNDHLAYLNGLISILEAEEKKLQLSDEQRAYNKERLVKYKEGFKQFYPHNLEQVFTIVPFTNFGNHFSQAEIDNHEYFKKLYVLGNGLTYGHTPTPAFYADILPKEVRAKCRYTPKYSNPDAPIPTVSELKALRADVETAFRNLKKIVLPHIKQAA